MKLLSHSLILFLSVGYVFAQPAPRFKVPAQSTPEDRSAGEIPTLRDDRSPRLERTHVLLQFDRHPSAETLAALTARGVAVLQDVPDDAVLVSMNDTVQLDDLGIRSAAPLDSRRKVSPLITDGDPSAASGYYLIELHPDVDPNTARRLVLNLGLELRENPDLLRQHLIVYTPDARRARATLNSLAAQDQVAYIFPASANLVAGIPANICGGALTAFGSIGQSIATNGEGWDGPGRNAATLSYVFQQVTAQLPSGVPQSEIVRAMAEWARVIQIAWQPGSDGSGNRTVNILFAPGAHGDSFPFDGPGGVVAHTFYPAPPNPEPMAGDMHFDDAESWRTGSNIDVFSVALHELGHALGLGHSDNPNDVMYPYFKAVSVLAPGDKAAILTMYAARTAMPPPGPLALTIDVPPATTISAAISLSGTVTGTAPVVTWITSTGASDGSTINGTSWSILSIPLAIGLNSITVTATDPTGSVSRTVSVTREVAPSPGPLALTINTPPATTTSAVISLSGTVTGGSSAPAVSWTTSAGAFDGSSINGADWVISDIPLVIGINRITVTAADATESISRIVSVNRIPPPVPLALTVNVVPASTTFAAMALSGTVTGGSGVPAVTWIANTGASGGSSISGTNWFISSIPLAMGFNSITVTATDVTGSVSRTMSITRTASLPGGMDTTGPMLNIAYPASTSFATTLASLTFRGTASDRSGVISVTWSTNTGGAGTAIGTGPLGAIQWSAAIPMLVGFNQVIIRATDTAGNVSWRTVVVTRR